MKDTSLFWNQRRENMRKKCEKMEKRNEKKSKSDDKDDIGVESPHIT